jgi:hypothetical protein
MNKKNLTAIILIALGIIPLWAITVSNEYTLLIFSIFVLFYFIGPKLRPLINRLPLSLFAKFFTLGILFSFLAEYLVLKQSFGYFSKNLTLDLLLSTGLYGSLIIIWYFLLKKYNFDLKGVFFSAGIWGIVIEQDFAVLLSFDPILYLYIFVAYGSLISIPFLLAGSGFDKIPRKKSKIKYIVAFFTQFIAYIVGTLWMALLMVFFGS